MAQTADIAITYSGLMGTRYDDPETPETEMIHPMSRDSGILRD